jgi:hypothetical protein
MSEKGELVAYGRTYTLSCHNSCLNAQERTHRSHKICRQVWLPSCKILLPSGVWSLIPSSVFEMNVTFSEDGERVLTGEDIDVD